MRLLAPHKYLIWKLFQCILGGIAGEMVSNLLSVHTMRPASWLWDHFHKGDRVNSSQHKGFCNYHTDYHLKTLLKAEEDAAAADATYTQRSKAVLLPEGPWHGRYKNKKAE